MDYYIHEFNELYEDFEKVIHDYPIFREMIEDIEKRDIRDINELLDKNDEYYLKEAINKLKKLISYVKNTSLDIQKEYDYFDKLAGLWEKKELSGDADIEYINSEVTKANTLIKMHDLKSIKEANQIMERLVNE